jgi:hypothetical protein
MKMAVQFFEDFLDEQTKSKEEIKIDWIKQRNDWIAYLNGFNEKIKLFLQPYLESGKLQLQEKKIDLTEEYIGSYRVDTLDIMLGNIKITLTPVGTNLIGAKGRVDMTGPKGKVKFVLVPKQAKAPSIRVQIIQGHDDNKLSREVASVSEWEWKISTPPPRINYIELEEESFLTALMEVVNG